MFFFGLVMRTIPLAIVGRQMSIEVGTAGGDSAGFDVVAGNLPKAMLERT
jgi:hypothetical protein